MEIAEVKAAVERSRRFTHDIDGRVFELLLPTQYACDCLLGDSRVPARVLRLMVLGALKGWSNITTRDLPLAADAVPGEPLPYSATAAELLLDERPDWEESLHAVLGQRVQERREYLKELAGN